MSHSTFKFQLSVGRGPEKVLGMISEGAFNGTNHECYWMLDEAMNEVGFIRIFDLDDVDDGYPLFDLRIREMSRGRGLGRAAVRWLTAYLFNKHPNLDRIAGSTRSDNTPMRRVFRACRYVKEGHFRKDWPAVAGGVFDTVKYGILREDWISGETTPVQWDDEP